MILFSIRITNLPTVVISIKILKIVVVVKKQVHTNAITTVQVRLSKNCSPVSYITGKLTVLHFDSYLLWDSKW